MRSRHRNNVSSRPEGAATHEPASTNSKSSSSWRRRILAASGLVCLLLIVCSPTSKNVLPAQSYSSTKPVAPPAKSPPSNGACDGFAGIYHIQSGDVGGAAATIFFQFVIAQLIYAEDHNLKPWVFFNGISHHVYDQGFHNATGSNTTLQFPMMAGMKVEHRPDVRLRRAAYPGNPYVDPSHPLEPRRFEFTGDGVWSHYFAPVSDFVPGDPSCRSKPLVTMDLWSITPGLHIYAPWTPRMWRYDVLPDYMQQRHLTLREWLTPQRLLAHRVAQRYIRPWPFLWDRADRLLASSKTCVGMHVRWSDKGGGRRLIGIDEFLPFVEVFLAKGGDCVFVATDSGKVLEHIGRNWPQRVRSVLRSQGNDVIRSNDETPVFEQVMASSRQLVSHHRTNSEVLIDILALSRCTFLLHGHSAVSDAAMYLNGDLIYQSVNLEDPDDFDLEEFGDLVDQILVQNTGIINQSRHFPQPWWMQAGPVARLPIQTTHGACDGYRGILQIAIGGGQEFSFGMTFFHFILNQLQYAEMYNLKPWIHLSEEGAAAVYDPKVHGGGSPFSFHMSAVAAPRLITRPEGRKSNGWQTSEESYPGDFEVEASERGYASIPVVGNGVWNTYFEPASDFDPRSGEALRSCQGKPLVILNDTLVASGIHKWAPWSVRAYKFSGMPDDLWWSKEATVGSSQVSDLADYYFTMRQKANQIVKKYFRAHNFIWRRVQEVNPIAVAIQERTKNAENEDAPSPCCLSVHIRQGDKENYGKRKGSRIKDYRPFIEAFLKATNTTAAEHSRKQGALSFVYLATDSWRVLDAIAENWPEILTSRMKTQGDRVVRSVRWVPPHLLEPYNRHRVNSEALVDILAMSQCQFLLHGSSTIAEAAIYMNLELHNASVNLDDPIHASVEEFESRVRSSGLCV